MRVLVIGASSRAGSAALSACLDKHYIVTAIIRNPSKLPLEVRNDPRLRIVKGDTTSHTSLVEAIHDQDAIIQAAVHGPSSSHGYSDSEAAIRNIVNAAREVQASRKLRLLGGGGPLVGSGKGWDRPIRLWVLSGQVLRDFPGKRSAIEGDMIPIHPKHYKNYAFLQPEARDIDWSRLCPGRTDMENVRVLLYECR